MNLTKPFAQGAGRARCAMLCLIALCSWGGAVIAAELPDMDRPVSLHAREITIDRFVQEFFGQLGLPVVVDPSVIGGAVNGDWQDVPAATLLDSAVRSLHIATYYDNATVYVYNASDSGQKILPVDADTAARIVRQATALGLPDRANYVKAAGESGLLVSGTPRFLEQIDELSVAVRRNSKRYVPQMAERLFRLKHTWAQDTDIDMGGRSVTVPGVVTILNRLLVDASVVGDAGGSLQQSADDASVTRADALDSLGDSALPPNTAISDRTRATTPAAGDDHRRIVAVPGQNAIMVRDLENRMAGYEQLVTMLDSEPYMLEIEATIIDVNTDSALDVGVNWRALDGDGSELLFGNGTVTDTWLQPGAQITPQALGGVLSLSVGNQAERFLARISALEEQGDAEIVSKPHVVTLSNIEAVLDTTQSFFVRVAGNDDAALFRITAGTTLRVTPHVYKDNGEVRIKLMVAITDGATSNATVDQIPVIGESTISTQAIVSAGDSLLVGGLVRESKRNAEYKVPLLGDIPGLGTVFRSRSRTGSKVERLFLITPRLAYRKGFERRLDAPVLQGEQASIVSSSARRLEAARQALAQTGRDTDTVPDTPGETWQAVPGSQPAPRAREATRLVQEPAPIRPTAPSTDDADDWQEVVPMATAGQQASAGRQRADDHWQAVQ